MLLFCWFAWLSRQFLILLPFFRMLGAYLGTDVFKKGLHHYLTRHQYSNTLTKVGTPICDRSPVLFVCEDFFSVFPHRLWFFQTVFAFFVAVISLKCKEPKKISVNWIRHLKFSHIYFAVCSLKRDLFFKATVFNIFCPLCTLFLVGHLFICFSKGSMGSTLRNIRPRCWCDNAKLDEGHWVPHCFSRRDFFWWWQETVQAQTVCFGFLI